MQVVISAHWRSELAVGATFSYCAAVQVARAAHVRSEVSVGATVSY